MVYRPERMKFGIFIAPFHRIGENPTLALKRDLGLVEYLDELDYDEAWWGEHHSYGRELIGDPVLMMAAASRTTRRIKLGTGVLSLAYHHPLMVADRMVQIDHMTQGRAMFGCGPGALSSDAYMMGIPAEDLRRRMGQALDAIMPLLRGETVTMKTDWFELRDARLQLASYSRPHLPVSVAATYTPSGPVMAGKYGVGLMSIAGIDNAQFDQTWGWAEESAAKHDKTIHRADWKVAMTMHVAQSRKEALAEIQQGYDDRAYSGDAKDPRAAKGALFSNAGTLAEQAERGAALIGSPDDVAAAIERILERTGGFGTLLSLAHEWASTEATRRSYELFARYVMPRFQGQLGPIESNRDWIEGSLREVFSNTPAAMERAYADAGKPLPAAMEEAKRRREDRSASNAGKAS
ncbi:Limonene 1,2-monooxygenase [Alphaproteobacteria bacterium SO-S41]|nr:Limonene 1,2-monooxygenase [Alphaproteobacteria bacterium SO-S41]